jgi:hypothetical protein
MKALIKTFALMTIPAMIGLISCGNETKKTDTEQPVVKPDSLPVKDSAKAAQYNMEKTSTFVPCSNDSMKELGMFIAGMKPQGEAKVLGKFFASADFKSFADNFEKKWGSYDSSRIKLLKDFRDKELAPNVGTTKKLFYPFSGPDILYGYTFFPEAEEYVMLGLEPVGTLPIYDEVKQKPDSMDAYYKKVNSSLLAILKYSFFRTAAMKTDLKNQELDGTLHLLFLFITRTGNTVCSARPLFIDTTGNIQYVSSFPKLEAKKCLNKGIEIVFNTPDNKTKKLYYFSLNIADGAVKSNKGMVTYLNNLGEVNTYLKGASYLMHETYFSVIRNAILDHSKHIIQDDSGIAFRYFTKAGGWSYKLYGAYTRPIPMFSYAYQKDLDSLYKSQGSKPIGFGIGYNFKDKNSNFMIATKK